MLKACIFLVRNCVAFARLRCFVTLILLAFAFTLPVLLLAADKGKVYHWNISESELRAFKKDMETIKYGRNLSILNQYNYSDPLYEKLLKWQEIVSVKRPVSFEQIYDFIKHNPNWPLKDKMSRLLEDSMSIFTDDNKILEWFAVNPLIEGAYIHYNTPITPKGKHLLAAAIIKNSNKYKYNSSFVLSLIKKAYIYYDFTKNEEDDFLQNFEKYINSKDHEKRLEKLLTDKNFPAAARIYRKLDQDYKKLYKARVALLQNQGGIDRLISDVPEHLQNDAGLVHDRVMWRDKYGAKKGVITLLLKTTRDLPVMGEKLWSKRRQYIRELIEQKKYNSAYLIAKNHGIVNSIVKEVDAEWWAGFLSYRMLGKPIRGFEHFKRITEIAKAPISLSRAYYWMARSKEDMKQSKEANIYYEKAAEFYLTYYGQLAAAKLGKKIELPTSPKVVVSDVTKVRSNQLAKAAYIFMKIDNDYYAKLFSQAAIDEAQTPAEKYLAAGLGANFGNYDYSLKASKNAYLKNHEVYLNSLFPKFNLVDVNDKPIVRPDKEAILAIIKQESEFNPNAISSAGARGLMQLMPSTAEMVARKKGLQFSRKKLTSDMVYNITLGSSYLAERFDNFDGSQILAFASYNAGIGNVRKWVKKYGDPRKLKSVEDVIDWVELIPFSETNNYVQRVVENYQVYRLIFGEDDNKQFNINEVLMGAGNSYSKPVSQVKKHLANPRR